MLKLILVKRRGSTKFIQRWETAAWDGVIANPVQHLTTQKVDGDELVTQQSCVFLVEEADADRFFEIVGVQNPGVTCEMYSLDKIGEAPAGAFTLKKLTADGVFPA